MDYRTKGKLALSTMLKIPKNIIIIEKLVHNSTSSESEYTELMYQTIADLKDSESIKDVYSSIKNGFIGWNHFNFKEMSRRINEQNEFIENPFEIEEGLHECRKCGSRRVFSYNKQVRGSDEGTSVFCECVACHSKWRESG